MKNLLLPIILFLALPCFSQTREYYVDVQIFGRTEGSIFNSKYSASIDVGTNKEGCYATICREDSNYLFESEMSVVNFMTDKGWQLMDFEDTPIPGEAAVIVVYRF